MSKLNMGVIYQLGEQYRERVKRRNKIRMKIISVCFVLVVIGLIFVKIIT